jgi:hypothetical protein
LLFDEELGGLNLAVQAFDLRLQGVEVGKFGVVEVAIGGGGGGIDGAGLVDQRGFASL